MNLIWASYEKPIFIKLLICILLISNFFQFTNTSILSNVHAVGLSDLTIDYIWIEVIPDGTTSSSEEMSTTSPRIISIEILGKSSAEIFTTEPLLTKIQPGESFEIYALISNHGDAPADGYYVDVYYDHNYGIGGPDDLDVGDTVSWSWGPWDAVQGVHVTKWIVDPDNDIEEKDETNNEMEYVFNIGVETIGMLNFDDYANRMGSMPEVIPSYTIYFPHFQQDSNWQTYYTIANPQIISASIDVTYYRQDGSIASTDSFTLDPDCKIGKSPVSGKGWIKVESNVPIVGMINFDDYRNRMGSMPGVTPEYELFFPHFDQGLNWQTYYTIVNPNTVDAQVDVFYHRADGSPIAMDALVLGPGQKIGKFTPFGTGWMEAICYEVPIIGMLNFDDYWNRMGSIPGIIPSDTLYFPHFHQDFNWQTYYAIVNVGPPTHSTLITVTYYAQDGSIILTDSFTLEGWQKSGRFPVPGTGWIKVESSDEPIIGMLNFDDYRNRMGSIPGVNPSAAPLFPHFHQDSSWQTYYTIVNHQNTVDPIGVMPLYLAQDGTLISSDFFGLHAYHKTGNFPVTATGWIKFDLYPNIY